MTARGTDWGLAALVALLIATGVLTLFEGSSHDAWVFAAHDALGVAIALLVVVKLRRVWSRIRALERWDGRTAAGVSVAALVIATLVSGWLWSTGADGTTRRLQPARAGTTRSVRCSPCSSWRTWCAEQSRRAGAT